jgi:chromosome segregation ATPase
MLKDKIFHKLEQHDAQFVKIDERFCVITDKLSEHDAQFVKIDEHFDAVDKQFVKIDKRFAAVDAHFEAVGAQFAKIDDHFEVVDDRLDKITDTLLDHSGQFKVLAGDINHFKQEILQGQDNIITILKRLDEDRVFTAQGLRRLDDEVSEHKVIIREHDVILGKVKTELNIV